MHISALSEFVLGEQRKWRKVHYIVACSQAMPAKLKTALNYGVKFPGNYLYIGSIAVVLCKWK